MTPANAGALAARQGLDSDANPHRPMTRNRSDWLDAWTAERKRLDAGTPLAPFEQLRRLADLLEGVQFITAQVSIDGPSVSVPAAYFRERFAGRTGKAVVNFVGCHLSIIDDGVRWSAFEDMPAGSRPETMEVVF